MNTCHDLSNEFTYIWLRLQSNSSVFSHCGFLFYRDAIEQLIGIDNFIKVYNKQNQLSYPISCISKDYMDKMVKIV